MKSFLEVPSRTHIARIHDLPSFDGMLLCLHDPPEPRFLGSVTFFWALACSHHVHVYLWDKSYFLDKFCVHQTVTLRLSEDPLACGLAPSTPFLAAELGRKVRIQGHQLALHPRACTLTRSFRPKPLPMSCKPRIQNSSKGVLPPLQPLSGAPIVSCCCGGLDAAQ